MVHFEVAGLNNENSLMNNLWSFSYSNYKLSGYSAAGDNVTLVTSMLHPS